MQLFEYGVAVVFLMALIAVARFKKYLTAEDTGSYNHVVMGLGILAIASLAQVYNGLGVFSRVPFLSEQPFFKLVFWIGIITGLAFLIDGVTNWVPLSRSYRQHNKERIDRLECIKKIEQLVRVESRAPVVFGTSLEYMVSGYDLEGGAAYLLSRRTRRAGCVRLINSGEHVSTADLSIPFERLSAHLHNDWEPSHSDCLQAALPAELKKPDLIVAVQAGKQLVGFFVLWAKGPSGLGDEERINLKIAGDIIGHELCRHVLQTQNDFQREVSQWTRSLSAGLERDAEPRDKFLTITESLRRKVGADYFSLSIRLEDNRLRRYTVGQTGDLLAESNIDPGKTRTFINTAYTTGEPILVDDLQTAAVVAEDDVITRSGYRSLAVLPVRLGTSTEGIMIVAFKKPGQLQRRKLCFVEAAAATASDLVAEEQHRYQMKGIQRRGYRINSFLADIGQSESLDSVFTRAAALIGSEIKPTVVRIATVGSEETFLNSKALQTARPAGMIAPEKGAMILSLLPYHELVLDTGRLMMINQKSTDRKMAEPEEKQVFGTAVSSALLVPIKVGSSTLGVISLGETRDWDRFQFRQADIQFVTAVASGLSLAIMLNRKKASFTLPKKQEATPPGTGDTDERGRIRSSLSGIMGSLEFLRSTKQPTDESVNRCLAIIDKSARRISEYISSDAT